MDDVVKRVGDALYWTATLWVSCFIIFMLAPAPTNPLCYNSAAYRNTHEQECIIDRVGRTGSTPGGGGGGGGFLGGLLGSLTGGLL